MGKYLKLFDTTSEYNTYINGNDKVLPNVSYCEDNGGIYFNPIEPPSRVIRTIVNVETTANPTALFIDLDNRAWNNVESALVTRPNGTSYEITYNDLVQYDPQGGGDILMSYQFDATGNHTLEYTLKPNVTSLTLDDMFGRCENTVRIEIPNCITSIGYITFDGSNKLTTLVLPNSITSLGADFQDSIIDNCPNLTNITILATTPPECYGIFFSNRDGYTIYVPAESVNAYKTAEDWTYEASRIQAIPSA